MIRFTITAGNTAISIKFFPCCGKNKTRHKCIFWRHFLFFFLSSLSSTSSTSSRHLRQQGSRHPRPLRRCLHWQRHRQQCRQRVPWHWRGMVHCCHLSQLQGPEVPREPGHAGFLCNTLHYLCLHLHRCAALPTAARYRWWAGRSPSAQDVDHRPLLQPVANVHRVLLTGGLLSHWGLLDCKISKPSVYRSGWWNRQKDF